MLGLLSLSFLFSYKAMSASEGLDISAGGVNSEERAVVVKQAVTA